MFAQLKTSILMLGTFTVLTGLVYPLVITGVAQVVFPHQANGSLISPAGKTLGSELVGQPFDDPKYFWSRPSATAPAPYNAAASTGSNLAVGNPAQLDAVKGRIDKLRAADPENHAAVPIDLVTASSCGLDPHISPAAAHYQAARVARARGQSPDKIESLVSQATEGRQFGILGEPTVNVLNLNLALDRQYPVQPASRSAP